MKQHLLINQERKYHGNNYSEGRKIRTSRHNHFAGVIADCNYHRDSDKQDQ